MRETLDEGELFTLTSLKKVATPTCYLDNYNRPVSNVHFSPPQTLNKLHNIH